MSGQRGLRRGNLSTSGSTDGVDHLYDLAVDAASRPTCAAAPATSARLRVAWEAVNATLLPDS